MGIADVQLNLGLSDVMILLMVNGCHGAALPAYKLLGLSRRRFLGQAGCFWFVNPSLF